MFEARIASLLGKPVRWAQNPPGDYDGRERTLEVFFADATEQRELLWKFSVIRSELELALGGKVIVVFHVHAETARLYPEIKDR